MVSFSIEDGIRHRHEHLLWTSSLHEMVQQLGDNDRIIFRIRSGSEGSEEFSSDNSRKCGAAVARVIVKEGLRVGRLFVDFCIQDSAGVKSMSLIYLQVENGYGLLGRCHGEVDCTHLVIQVLEEGRELCLIPIPKHENVIQKSQPEEWVGARDQVANAFSSKEPRKRLAKGGAHLVPMATPLIWLKKLLWNLKVLSRMMIFNRSLARFFIDL